MEFKKFFLPTPENDYTPHLLQRAAMGMMFLLVLLSFTAVNLQALLWQSSDWLVGTVLPAVVVDLTNNEREEQAQAPLRRNALLDEAARLKAEDMAKNGYFAHYSPDGVSPWHWFDEVSYVYAHAGENLAIHFKDSGAVVDAWMKSPAHKANIVNNKYTEIGVGTAKGKFDGFDTVFVVQLFGTPAIANNVEPAVVPLEVVPAPVALIENQPVAQVEEDELGAPIANQLVAGEQVVENEVVETPKAVVLRPKEISQSTQVVELEPGSAPVAIAQEVEIIELPDEVASVLVEDERTSIFSTHFATSSGLEPAILGNVSGTTAPQKVSFINSIATKPSLMLQTTYLIIGLLVAVLLLVSIVVGIHHTRPLQVVYGVAMLMIMSGLFYVHIALTTSVVIAAEPESFDRVII
jgi:hypothetical protein